MTEMPADLVKILDTWRDTWHHRIEELGDTVEDYDRHVEHDLLDGVIPQMLGWLGAISDPREDEVARVALAALVGVNRTAMAAHLRGDINHDTYDLVDSWVALAAVPWLHVLGLRPECINGHELTTAPPVLCPSCGMRLFGPVAERGACLSCFPELPSDPVTP